MNRFAITGDSIRRTGQLAIGDIQLNRFWKRLSLTQQFGLTAGLVMLVGMLVVGSWVEEQIKMGVTNNAAASTALFMDSFVTPLAQDLATSDTLTIGPVLALDEVLNSPGVKERFYSVRIWKPDGVVAYSDDLAMVGERFEPSPGLLEAREGEVVSEFSRQGVLDNVSQATPARPLLEIYSPIRAQFTGEVIAVVEFYEDATALVATLDEARRNSWLLVAAVTIFMALALLGIVNSGTRLIERQKRFLQKALDDNSALLRRVERASGRSAELTEQHLRRVSADLHDGPAQLVSFAALRMGSLSLVQGDQKTKAEVAIISEALADAMQDIRGICNGLSLPEIEHQSLQEIVKSVVGSHEARTGTQVAVALNRDDPEMPSHIKICVYRFLQEGLNNAFRHGGGKDQRIKITISDKGGLSLEVLNKTGAGTVGSIDEATSPNPKNTGLGENTGIGLVGLRERVEALGGDIDFSASEEGGARLSMWVHIGSGDNL